MGWGGLEFTVLVCVFNAVRTFLENELDLKYPIASQRGSIPQVTRKPMASCVFLGGWVRTPVYPLDPPIPLDIFGLAMSLI